MKNDCYSNIFEYDSNNKIILFFNEEDYNWSKIIIQALSRKLYLDGQLLSPIQLGCLDKHFTLILTGLTEPDEQKILEILKKNGLEQKNPIQHDQSWFTWETLTHVLAAYTPKFLSNQNKHEIDKKLATNPEEVPLLQRDKKNI